MDAALQSLLLESMQGGAWKITIIDAYTAYAGYSDNTHKLAEEIAEDAKRWRDRPWWRKLLGLEPKK